MKEIAITVPCFNEGRRIAVFLEGLKMAVEKQCTLSGREIVLDGKRAEL